MDNRCVRVKYGVEKLFGLCVSPEVYSSGRSDAHDVGHQSFEQSLWAFGFYYVPKKDRKNSNWINKEENTKCISTKSYILFVYRQIN